MVWKLECDGENVEDNTEIATCFNEFFVSKIEKLKSNINNNLTEDPLKVTKMIGTFTNSHV